MPEAAARLFWSVKIQERRDRVTEGLIFIETEMRLGRRRERQRDVRETETYCTFSVNTTRDKTRTF